VEETKPPHNTKESIIIFKRRVFFNVGNLPLNKGATTIRIIENKKTW